MIKQDDNVIKFPITEKQWREIEASIRYALEKYAPPQDVVDHILQETKKVFLKHCSNPFVLNVPVPLDFVGTFNDSCEKIANHFKNITTLLMVEIMTREIELYYHRLEAE